MDQTGTDQEMLRQFVKDGSEPAFEALVQRHLNLVFATALRRTGDREAAEEVAQNVFITLARKAQWLGRETSLAGWLHRAAVLEARQWWRAEKRRRRRQEEAACREVAMKLDNETSEMAAALDDALLELPENFRQPLLLRFFEGRNHREIGALLGIGEDAARKRVDKALDRLSSCLGKRSVKVTSISAAAIALEQLSHAAPAGLVNPISKGALAALSAGSTPMLGLWLPKLLNPGRAQLATICLAAVLLPTVWQSARIFAAHGEQRRLQMVLADLQTERKEIGAELFWVQRQLRHASNSLARIENNSPIPAASMSSELAGIDPRLFLWNETVDYVCVPKSVMTRMAFEGTGHRPSLGWTPLGLEQTMDPEGGLSTTLLSALGFSDTEQERLQAYFQPALEQYRAFAENQALLFPLDALELNPPAYFITNEHTRAWMLPNVSEVVAEWKRAFESGLAELACVERAGVILEQAARDNSLSRCFQGFGAEEPIIIATPLPSGGVNLLQRYFRNGTARWSGGQRVSFHAALTPAPNDTTGQLLDPIHSWLGRDLPSSLVDYLEQWRAANPGVPDEPSKP